MLIVPFTDYDDLLFLHAISVPTLLVHWYFNNNTCALTLLEQKFRELSTGIKDENYIKGGFLTKLINPIYDFPKNNETYSDFVYSLTILIWIIALYKLYTRYKNGNMTEINKKIDLLKAIVNKYIK
jgi:hypothetical protein